MKVLGLGQGSFNFELSRKGHKATPFMNSPIPSIMQELRFAVIIAVLLVLTIRRTRTMLLLLGPGACCKAGFASHDVYGDTSAKQDYLNEWTL